MVSLAAQQCPEDRMTIGLLRRVAPAAPDASVQHDQAKPVWYYFSTEAALTRLDVPQQSTFLRSTQPQSDEIIVFIPRPETKMDVVAAAQTAKEAGTRSFQSGNVAAALTHYEQVRTHYRSD